MPINIELIQKEAKKESVFSFLKFDSWLSFFVGILILVLIVCGGLWGYEKYLEQENNDLDLEIVSINMNRDLILESEIKNISNKIRDLKSITKQRFFLSDLFSLIEKLTVPQSYFDKFLVSVKDNTSGVLNLQVNAAGYSDAASIIKIFEDEKSFKDVSVSTIKAEDNNVLFSINMNFNPMLIE